MIKIVKEKSCYVNGIKAPILHEFNFLYSGWELDNYGYIVEYEGNPRLVNSDHGSLHLVSNSKANEADEYSLTSDVELLIGFINDYKNAIEKTQKAIDLLTEANNN